MKALIIGCGSMGKRRARLIRSILPSVRIMCVDSNKERLLDMQEKGCGVFETMEAAVTEHPDMAFVCTSPGTHANIILQLVENNIHVFTELNLTNEKYDQIQEKAREHHVTVFMSSTLLYKRQMEMIKEIVDRQKKPLTYIYHVGQYLPDWHPWESYKSFFVGKKETNGVREILAIQLPWLIETFGHVGAISAFGRKSTDLEIDFNDSITLNISHDSGTIGVFVADVVSRKAMTELEIIGEDVHLRWGGHGDDFVTLDIATGEWRRLDVYQNEEHIEGYADNITEEPYREEIRDFLDVIDQKRAARYSLEKDDYVLTLIDKIEEQVK